MTQNLSRWGEGLKVTLTAIPGLTVDAGGKQLLTLEFLFQIPPLEEFAITRQFTMGNYDTIVGKQYTRRGSNQLRMWQFDTLVMRQGHQQSAFQFPETKRIPIPGLPGATRRINAAPGVANGANVGATLSPYLTPGWVPFPQVDGGTGRPFPPDWWAGQLQKVFNAGAPFRFTAGYRGVPAPIISCPAVLLQYNEAYEAGEDDAIYFKGLQFSEWRKPVLSEHHEGKPTNRKGHGSGDQWVTLYTTGHNAGACLDVNGKRIPKKGDTTLAILAHHFYGEPGEWRDIARANNLKGGSQNQSLVKFPRFSTSRAKTYKVKIPTPKTSLAPAVRGR